MANSSSPTTSRVEWIDYAKGICILAVVTLYATREVQGIAHTTSWMQYVIDFAQPFRMPDFFLIAGLLVPRVIDRPWRSYIDTKILYFVYFYTVWVTIGFVFQNRAAVNLTGPDRFDLLPDYLQLFYAGPPYGPLWFIYILAIFFLAVRLLRSFPVTLVLAAAAVLQVARLKTGVRLFDQFAQYFVFFYSGYAFSRHLFGIGDWAQRHALPALAIFVGWFAANTVLVDLQWASLPGISLLMGFAGALAIALLSTLLARASWMRWLRYLGRHSIIIYLGFIIPLRITRGLVANPVFITDTGTLSILVTAVSIAGAVVLYRAVRNTPLRFLFFRPAWASIAAARRSRSYS